MRAWLWGLASGLGLAGLWWAASGLPELWAQGERPSRGDPSVVVPYAWSTETGSLVVVVDTQTRVMGVYEVHRTTGGITLKSVRNLAWDLQLEELNTSGPTPREIRALLDRR